MGRSGNPASRKRLSLHLTNKLSTDAARQGSGLLTVILSTYSLPRKQTHMDRHHTRAHTCTHRTHAPTHAPLSTPGERRARGGPRIPGAPLHLLHPPPTLSLTLLGSGSRQTCSGKQSGLPSPRVRLHIGSGAPEDSGGNCGLCSKSPTWARVVWRVLQSQEGHQTSSMSRWRL